MSVPVGCWLILIRSQRALKHLQCCTPSLIWRVSPSYFSAGISWFAYIYFCSVFDFKQWHASLQKKKKKKEGRRYFNSLSQHGLSNSWIYSFSLQKFLSKHPRPKRTWKLQSAYGIFLVFRIPLAKLCICIFLSPSVCCLIVIVKEKTEGLCLTPNFTSAVCSQKCFSGRKNTGEVSCLPFVPHERTAHILFFISQGYSSWLSACFPLTCALKSTLFTFLEFNVSLFFLLA